MLAEVTKRVDGGSSHLWCTMGEALRHQDVHDGIGQVPFNLLRTALTRCPQHQKPSVGLVGVFRVDQFDRSFEQHRVNFLGLDLNCKGLNEPQCDLLHHLSTLFLVLLDMLVRLTASETCSFDDLLQEVLFRRQLLVAELSQGKEIVTT